MLVGDIFDFCLGSSTYYKKKFANIGIALSDLATRGTKVIFIQGNHEVAIDFLDWKNIEFIVAKTKIIERISVDTLYEDASNLSYLPNVTNTINIPNGNFKFS